MAFVPESPWWLDKQGRYEEAESAIGRLSTRTREECRNTLQQIEHTIQLEADMQSGSSYMDCFRGTNLRRTEICMVVFAGQQVSGAAFAYTPTYFFLQAGVNTENPYTIGIGSTAMAFLGTLMSWVLLAYFGRRTLYVLRIAASSCAFLIVGICSAVSTVTTALWAQVSFILGWKLIYSLTIGPICYAVISKTSAVGLRQQTAVVARNTYACVQILGSGLNPYMLNPIEWNWNGKAGFFWAAAAGATAVWSYFRLPETENRTYEELDVSFEKNVSARCFAKTEVDAYADGRGLAKT